MNQNVTSHEYVASKAAIVIRQCIGPLEQMVGRAGNQAPPVAMLQLKDLLEVLESMDPQTTPMRIHSARQASER